MFQKVHKGYNQNVATKRRPPTPIKANDDDPNDGSDPSTADCEVGRPTDDPGPIDGRSSVATFESYLDDALQRYEDDLAAARDPQQDERLQKAIYMSAL